MLDNFQRKILDFLASSRSENSYIAGGAALNIDQQRLSRDIDIFHDDMIVCQKSFIQDIALLKQNGYCIKVLRSPHN